MSSRIVSKGKRKHHFSMLIYEPVERVMFFEGKLEGRRIKLEKVLSLSFALIRQRIAWKDVKKNKTFYRFSGFVRYKLYLHK